MWFTFIEPGSPTNVRCTQKLDTSIDLSWTAPSDPNGLIKHYQINISPQGNSGYSINTTTNKTEMLVGGLNPGNNILILSVILWK